MEKVRIRDPGQTSRIRNTGRFWSKDDPTDVGLDSADLLLGHGVPDPGHPDHGAGVHDPVPEGVRVVPAHGVHAPIRRPEKRACARGFYNETKNNVCNTILSTVPDPRVFRPPGSGTAIVCTYPDTYRSGSGSFQQKQSN